MRKPKYLRDMKNEEDVQNAIEGLETAVTSLKDYRNFGLRHDGKIKGALFIVDKVSCMLHEMCDEWPR